MTSFALNHIAASRLDPASFLDLASRLGLGAVEMRNDLAGNALADGTPPEAIRTLAEAKGLSIASINALQRFNEWNEARADEARTLAAQARQAGAKALVLCPVNQEDFWTDDGERLAALRQALSSLAPILAEQGLIGLVEPLGFAECSLRLKREAVDAIAAVGEEQRFKLVHDTFHHFVAGETEIFPQATGLVHISGVEDPAVPREAMRDPHRVLVGPGDRIDNVGQLRALAQGGYRGLWSFEPFATSVAESPTIEDDLRASIDFVGSRMKAAAAA